MPDMLEVAGLHRGFGGVRAIDGVSFEVAEGEVVGVIGPNGSGKSTLVSLLMGTYRAQSGTIRFAGTDITRLAPHRRAHLGMARTFQETRLFFGLSARDNVLLAAAQVNHGSDPAAAAADALAYVGLADLAGEPARALTHARQRLLMLAVALASRPRLVLLDEPAVGTAGDELTTVIDVIRGVRERYGCATLLVDHNMRLVMDVCDRIVVLDFGQRIAAGTPAQVRDDPRVIAAYFGTELREPTGTEPA